jgi:hypothetical protein
MRSLCLLAAFVAGAWAQVQLNPRDHAIDVVVDGKPFTTFYFGQNTTKPYLHPLRTASGKIITRGYPMENIAGEPRDHIHHTSMWFSHGDVNGIDFWANDPSQFKEGRKGRIVARGEMTHKGNAISGTFEWRGNDDRVLLTENRTMTFRSTPALRMIDFDVVFTAVERVKFGDTKEGAFAMRLAAPLEERHTGKMTNAEGATGEKQVWGKPSPWVDYSGEIDGEKVGVAIFDHPSNPKHPTYWHSRAYGLFAANIFGEHDFFNDKARDGSVTVEPGKSLRFRYRILIHPGDTASSGIGAKYQEYVHAGSN